MNLRLKSAVECAENTLRKRGLHVTLGGEPTYVPFNPKGDEWHVSALGPTKLDYAYALAEILEADALPGAVSLLTTGKSYPGEQYPRWVLRLFWLNSGRRIIRRISHAKAATPNPTTVRRLKRLLSQQLNLGRARWLELEDPVHPDRAAHVLPLEFQGRSWRSERWRFSTRTPPALLTANGPAGLRLPLWALDDRASKRAFVLQHIEDTLHVFVPPLAQKPFIRLLRLLSSIFTDCRVHSWRLEGYLPADENQTWTQLGLSADPGVLEANLPPCPSWADYTAWMERLDKCAALAGLRSSKQIGPGEAVGTGGGCHVLLGGETLPKNPFFTRPGLVASMCRYFQHHPALAYLFTGKYVGPASQAPRTDETLTPLLDLEMAYRALESRDDGGDHRELIGESLRHLHSDPSGSSHRSEISFDKFWAPSTPGGCLGLIEFRAIEALPEVRWNCAAAALCLAILARVAVDPFREPLRVFGPELHDRFLLPSQILADLDSILGDLAAHGFRLPADVYHELWEWRFPILLRHGPSGAGFQLRRALEVWPLLCETPVVGGTTSRFVDTSIEHIEVTASGGFSATHRIFFNRRELMLTQLEPGLMGSGLRFRASALFPSLHPAQPAQTPLTITLTTSANTVPIHEWQLADNLHLAKPVAKPSIDLAPAAPCVRPFNSAMTCDLRL